MYDLLTKKIIFVSSLIINLLFPLLPELFIYREMADNEDIRRLEGSTDTVGGLVIMKKSKPSDDGKDKEKEKEKPGKSILGLDQLAKERREDNYRFELRFFIRIV